MQELRTHAITTPRRRAALAGLIFLIASAEVIAAEGVVVESASASPTTALAQATPELEAVLKAARSAAQREAWSEQQHGLHFTGSSNAGGVDAQFELFLTSGGDFRYALGGRLARTLTFDGSILAMRVRSGPVQVLEHSDRETWLLSQWIHSGYWLEPSCPLRVELSEDQSTGVGLQVSFAGSPSTARLELDPETWLPRELNRPALGGETITQFLQYDLIAGIPIARLVQSDSHGELTELRVLEADAASADSGARYTRDTAPATDVHFDAERAPELELKRVRSGHLLVHPLVDGQDVGWFILDSGAGQICIDPAVGDELGLEEFGSLPAVGVAGSIRTSYRQGETLELGPMHLDNPVYVEIDLAFLAPIFGVDVAGICGYEIFARSVVQLDIEAVSLSLFDPATSELEPESWSPLALVSRVPCLPCRFEGERDGLFKLDLGDSGTITFYSPAVQSLGLLEGREVTETQVGGVGGMGRALSGELEWFEVGGERFEPLAVTFSQAEAGVFASAYSMGNLGTSMLRPFVVVFDYSSSRIALLPRE